MLMFSMASFDYTNSSYPCFWSPSSTGLLKDPLVWAIVAARDHCLLSRRSCRTAAMGSSIACRAHSLSPCLSRASRLLRPALDKNTYNSLGRWQRNARREEGALLGPLDTQSSNMAAISWDSFTHYHHVKKHFSPLEVRRRACSTRLATI
jgi:hypothetical protein